MGLEFRMRMFSSKSFANSSFSTSVQSWEYQLPRRPIVYEIIPPVCFLHNFLALGSSAVQPPYALHKALDARKSSTAHCSGAINNSNNSNNRNNRNNNNDSNDSDGSVTLKLRLWLSAGLRHPAPRCTRSCSLLPTNVPHMD